MITNVIYWPWIFWIFPASSKSFFVKAAGTMR
jgi:hypothetical protein